jgi:hypothetical protein
MCSVILRGCKVLWKLRSSFVVCDIYCTRFQRQNQGYINANVIIADFLVTIPFSFIAERWGVKVVLLCNLLPRMFMSAWAMVVGLYSHHLFFFDSCESFCSECIPGNYPHILPTEAIIAGPFLNILGGECVFQSTIFTLTSALASEYVQR